MGAILSLLFFIAARKDKHVLWSDSKPALQDTPSAKATAGAEHTPDLPPEIAEFAGKSVAELAGTPLHTRELLLLHPQHSLPPPSCQLQQSQRTHRWHRRNCLPPR